MALFRKNSASSGSDAGDLTAIAGCELLSKIAHGPMSTIYLGRDGSGQQVVVKVFSARGNQIAEKLSVRLHKPWEGERARAMMHPNIVRTFSFGKEDGTYYIVMEYLSGRSFAEHIRIRTPGVLARRVDVLIGAAAALAYVHEKGIIHRDVCPKNLIFDSQGVIKLIDFGVAIHKEDRLKPTEVRTGRPSYLAPEIIRHNHFDTRTDMYAFGVTMYEAFTGQRPFLTEERDELFKMHLQTDPPPPSKIDPSLAPEVDKVVLRALDKAPQRRFGSMKEAIAALNRLRARQ